MIDDLYKVAVKAAVSAGQRILEIYNEADFVVSYKSDESPLTKADKAAHDIIIGTISSSSEASAKEVPSPIPILSEEGRSTPYAERSKWTTFWLVDPLDGTKEFIKKNGEFTVNIALIEDGSPVFGVVYAPVLDEIFVGVVNMGAWILSKEEALGEWWKVERRTLNVESPPSLKLRSVKKGPYRVVASRSHLNADTEEYLEKLRTEKGKIETVSKGSSLKLCMVAKGEADEYPRLGPTMEWDVAAAHAVLKASGKNVYKFESFQHGARDELEYNKENLLNPYFIAN